MKQRHRRREKLAGNLFESFLITAAALLPPSGRLELLEYVRARAEPETRDWSVVMVSEGRVVRLDCDGECELCEVAICLCREYTGLDIEGEHPLVARVIGRI